jgi:hypothetical protein
MVLTSSSFRRRLAGGKTPHRVTETSLTVFGPNKTNSLRFVKLTLSGLLNRFLLFRASGLISVPTAQSQYVASG